MTDENIAVSSNLVVALRMLVANPNRREAPAGARQLCEEAADEIERLRAENAALSETLKAANDEAVRLQAALTKLWNDPPSTPWECSQIAGEALGERLSVETSKS